MHLLITTIEGFEDYITGLIIGEELFTKPGIDDHDLVMLSLEISAQVYPMNNMFYNIQQDFEKSFTRLAMQISSEKATFEK